MLKRFLIVASIFCFFNQFVNAELIQVEGSTWLETKSIKKDGNIIGGMFVRSVDKPNGMYILFNLKTKQYKVITVVYEVNGKIITADNNKQWENIRPGSIIDYMYQGISKY